MTETLRIRTKEGQIAELKMSRLQFKLWQKLRGEIMSEHDQSLANARLGCEWLQANLLEGKRSIVEEVVIDAGNAIRRSVDVDERARELIGCLCDQFKLMAMFFECERGTPKKAPVPERLAKLEPEEKEAPESLRNIPRREPAKPVNPKKGKK
jgi:hypothetical protein